MSERAASGQGGAIVAAYATAARLAEWTLEPIGPGLYRLRAALTHVVPPYLALEHLALWIARGNISWNWLLKPGDFSVVERQLDAVLGPPQIGPRK